MHESVAPSPDASPGGNAGRVQKGIPETKAGRDRLRERIAEYVRVHRPTPPLSFDEVTHHTDAFLAEAGVAAEHRGYVAVGLHGEVWRDTLAKIPFHRRVLLLPQCLRDPDECPAEIDEFGLKCRRCGRCRIGPLADEAERLGYVVLIAEGTTVVTSLIASGKIEAVIGTSCMATLERVFAYVEQAGVPAMAVPLLRDGCANTDVDFDRLLEAIYLTDGDATRRLDVEALRAEVRGWFEPAALGEVLGEPGGRTEQLARDWLTAGGKRWRPILAACAFQALRRDAEQPLPGSLHRLAVAVECFHKASLAHDDIEDGDERRYGRKTLHAAHGVPVALNVGDFLLGEGYRLIGAIGCSAEQRGQMLRVAAAGHRGLSLGQGAELCWRADPGPLTPEEVLDIFRRKTAPAFDVALRLGAICAGADGEVTDVLGRYSEHLGIAYQIRDDIGDLLGGDGRGDAEAMRPSVVLALAYAHAQGAAKALLRDLWCGRVDLGDPAAAGEVAATVAVLEAEAAARDLLNAHRQQAVHALTALDNPSLKGLLRRVLLKIFTDVDTADWCGEHPTGHAGRRPAGRRSSGR